MSTYSAKIDLRNFIGDYSKLDELARIIHGLAGSDMDIELENFLDFQTDRPNQRYRDLFDVINLLPPVEFELAVARFTIKVDLARMERLINNGASSLLKEFNKRKVHVELIYPELANFEPLNWWGDYVANNRIS